VETTTSGTKKSLPARSIRQGEAGGNLEYSERDVPAQISCSSEGKRLSKRLNNYRDEQILGRMRPLYQKQADLPPLNGTGLNPGLPAWKPTCPDLPRVRMEMHRNGADHTQEIASQRYGWVRTCVSEARLEVQPNGRSVGTSGATTITQLNGCQMRGTE